MKSSISKQLLKNSKNSLFIVGVVFGLPLEDWDDFWNCLNTNLFWTLRMICMVAGTIEKNILNVEKYFEIKLYLDISYFMEIM